MWRWRKIIYGMLLLLLALDFILAWIIQSAHFSQDLKVVFLNVGQGDAILIEQGQNQFLIDGGRNEKLLLTKLGKFIPFWDRQLEVIEATHPDSDHITGLVGALKNYQVNYILKTQAESQTKTFQALQRAIEKEKETGGKALEAFYGMRLKFPNGAVAEIVYPWGHTAKNSRDKNENSIVTKITYGKNSFLLTGDLPSDKEQQLIDYNLPLQSTVLKAGHHGSRYSTSDNFLDYIHPQVAIISVGKNSYGHPHSDVLARLRQHQVKFWRTDKRGDIEYRCNPQKCQTIFHWDK